MIASIWQSIVKNWWVFAVRGVIAIAFGILAFVRPDISLATLVALFGAYAFLDGIVMLVATPLLSGTPYLGWALLDGVLGVAAGVITFLHPVAAAVTLVYFLGVWLILGGVFRISLAIELRKQIDDEWFYVLGGMLSLGAGVLTVLRPGPSALAWVWVLGVYALLYGLAMMAVAIRLHRAGTQLSSASAA